MVKYSVAKDDMLEYYIKKIKDHQISIVEAIKGLRKHGIEMDADELVSKYL